MGDFGAPGTIFFSLEKLESEDGSIVHEGLYDLDSLDDGIMIQE